MDLGYVTEIGDLPVYRVVLLCRLFIHLALEHVYELRPIGQTFARAHVRSYSGEEPSYAYRPQSFISASVSMSISTIPLFFLMYFMSIL